MKITGHMLIGQDCVSGTAGAFRAFSPALAADIEPAFGGAAPTTSTGPAASLPVALRGIAS
ncbi:hypothetical protein RA280_36665 [Cupriavidus sp. CV2]|uniref:hypothetical protein n=1 Tax=Cupriavidus TaxID=106589 RepID=UPI002916AFC1|nr:MULTISPECIES: hypothetical protein [unclassified Cupriavidus]MDW3687176.1 hypothetical protein [Cupriavidus sp. CV2]